MEKKGYLVQLYKESNELEEIDFEVNMGRKVVRRSHTNQIVRYDRMNCKIESEKKEILAGIILFLNNVIFFS